MHLARWALARGRAYSLLPRHSRSIGRQAAWGFIVAVSGCFSERNILTGLLLRMLALPGGAACDLRQKLWEDFCLSLKWPVCRTRANTWVRSATPSQAWGHPCSSAWPPREARMSPQRVGVQIPSSDGRGGHLATHGPKEPHSPGATHSAGRLAMSQTGQPCGHPEAPHRPR